MNRTSVEDTCPLDGNAVPVQRSEDEDHGKKPNTSTPKRTPHRHTNVVQSFTDGVLSFLSHASNRTLGVCLVGLGASTYLFLGRVGLVIIGVAGGVVLHAVWDGTRLESQDEATKRTERGRRRETSVEVAKRILDWRRSHELKEEQSENTKVFANEELDFSSFEPETATALETFTNAVIKDYVHYWYDPTIPGEETFPASCQRTFTAFLLSLTNHIRRKRPADAFLDFATNASSIIIVFLNELSVALNASPIASAEDAVSAYLQLKPDSSLSYMLDQGVQRAKLVSAAEDILQSYVDPKAYNFPPVHVFLKEVLAQLVLGYTLELCSKPEWINDWIVYGLEESETTKEVMDLVDASVERGTKGTVTNGRQPADATAMPREEVKSKKVPTPAQDRQVNEHDQQMDRAEEAMDEAMKEAHRLTQLILEEDERRTRQEQEKRAVAARSSDEDMSDGTTFNGATTPNSSQSDKERQIEEAVAWSSMDSSPIAQSSLATSDDQPITPTSEKQQFISFDQLLPPSQPTALADVPEIARHDVSQLTLYNANISIFDDSVPGERTSIKAKPTIDYLIQVEPSNKQFGGWMIARKYADFETLHEILRRISVITGVRDFTAAHEELPRWRTNTKPSLRQELERYLTDAVRFQPLAESEGMRRFLEKDQGLQSRSPGVGNKGFGWPTPDAFGRFGGDMMNVLTKAPKQVAGGSKAVFGGVAGLVGGVSGKRPANQSQASLSRYATSPLDSGSGVPGHRTTASTSEPFDPYRSRSFAAARQSQESARSIHKPPLSRQSSSSITESTELKPRTSSASKITESGITSPSDSIENRANLSTTASRTNDPNVDAGLDAAINLPPPPSEMPDDFDSSVQPTWNNAEGHRSSSNHQLESMVANNEVPPPIPPRPSKPYAAPKGASKVIESINERETSVAVELMFAVITELYTLSSAWQIRRTLLVAAKTYLLRPGNPILLSIRDLLQESLLDANLSDSGLAAHIYKLRENSLPTAEELERWKVEYPERTPEQKEELRIKARRLLVTKGMPQALTSVMGAAASGEALRKVFDCLQIEKVSKGLMFGLMLQALRVVTH